MKAPNLCILDCETGGLDKNINPITEVALIGCEPISFKQLTSFETYVKPYSNLKIDKKALEVTMVSLDDINNGMDHKKVVKTLIENFKELNVANGKPQGRPILVGHNIPFDIGFLMHIFNLSGKNLFDYIAEAFLDTLAFAKMLWVLLDKNEATKMRLVDCCKRAGIKLTDAHGAMNDVKATKELIRYFLERLRNEGYTSVESSKRETNQPIKRKSTFYQF